MAVKTALEDHFARYRNNIIGNEVWFDSPYGEKRLLYADWTASGRAYRPIEQKLQNDILPFWANTHTGTTVSGTLMSKAYEEAKRIIKYHVKASDEDVLIFCGSGMTGAVNKLQRILGLRVPERLQSYMAAGSEIIIDEALRPVVFVTDMEHHSNQVSWQETIADVKIIPAGEDGNVDLEQFSKLLEQYRHRKNKIAAVTACSNVTGIETPYAEIAQMIHSYGGLCFVDFACSAPYAVMDMHPQAAGEQLDAIYFSFHKFLGGPGTPGVLIFNRQLYSNKIPDQPGGGTVIYSNPWQVCCYVSDIETREDGGTPPLLQGIKAGLCIRLKEEMGVEHMRRRKDELLQFIFERFEKMNDVDVLEEKIRKRLGVVSFIIKGAHYNLVVKLLNDRFGIQARGGCSCAGTYGHRLLRVDQTQSYEILDAIQSGNLSAKPGWVRLSVHPTMSTAEAGYLMDAIELTAANFRQWTADYCYDELTNEYTHRSFYNQIKARQTILI